MAGIVDVRSSWRGGTVATKIDTKIEPMLTRQDDNNIALVGWVVGWGVHYY